MVVDHPIREAREGPGVRLVRIGVKLYRGSFRDEPRREFLDCFPRGLGIRAAEASLQTQPSCELSGLVGTASAKLRVIESVDVV